MNNVLSPVEAVMWRVGQDPGLRMTVGNLLLLEQAPDPSELIERLGAASETAFRLRQRPSEATYLRRRPHWESERDFDPARHVRVLTVAPPGDRRQVLDLVALLEAIPFDPGRSPWDATLIEGLADNKAGVFLRAHHVLTDGFGGASMLAALLDETSPTLGQRRAAPPEADTRNCAYQRAPAAQVRQETAGRPRHGRDRQADRSFGQAHRLATALVKGASVIHVIGTVRDGDSICLTVRTVGVEEPAQGKGHCLAALEVFCLRRSLARAALNDSPRSRHTTPAIAPRMITTPMAMNQDIRAKTTPMVPYFLSSEMTVPEKMIANTTAIPTQHTAVAMAEGNSSLQEIRPPNRNHWVNHQKAVETVRPMTPRNTGPPALCNDGPTQPTKAEKPTSTASQMSRRGMSLMPRLSTSKARSYSCCMAVAAATPPSRNHSQAVPVMALEVADEEVNSRATSAEACLVEPEMAGQCIGRRTGRPRRWRR